FSFCLLRPPPIDPLFPYTTLFRSSKLAGGAIERVPKSRRQEVNEKLSRSPPEANCGARGPSLDILDVEEAGSLIRQAVRLQEFRDRKSTRLNSSHRTISYAVFCLK